MRGKKTKSFAAIAWLVAVSMVLLWAVCMGCMTWAVAREYYETVMHGTVGYATELINSSLMDRASSESIFAGSCLRAMGHADAGPVYYGNMDRVMGSGAAMITDSGRRVLYKSGDFVRFNYMTEQNAHGRNGYDGWGWLDLEADPELKACIQSIHAEDALAAKPGWHWEYYLRLTGYFDGERMVPVKVDYAPHYYGDSWPVGDWIPLLERNLATQGEVLTVYAENAKRFEFNEEHPVRYKDKYYANLLCLLEGNTYREDVWSWTEFIRFDEAEFAVSFDGETTETYTISTVLVYYPLKSAVNAIWKVYIWTFVLGTALVGVILWVIHRNLIQPLHALESGFWSVVRTWPCWKEPERLACRLEEMDATLKERNDSLRKKENELFRLDQAREFAVKNEEKRARMVSGLAHELKTPLAIISGYAQGLQEQIAEEKREQYLENILSETNRMDGLVMQMLELSRLEAGKITLARDEFDLGAMIRAVLDKFELEAEQKKLHIELDLDEEKSVHADEGRMEQIVRNLVSNAVRYVPEGGCIRVTLRHLAGFAEVRIYNDAPAFTGEEIARIWDAFYRTDRARQGKGTGLGLAITKNLVQLHGGSCSVRNTENGVEFSFRIPQKY